MRVPFAMLSFRDLEYWPCFCNGLSAMTRRIFPCGSHAKGLKGFGHLEPPGNE